MAFIFILFERMKEFTHANSSKYLWNYITVPAIAFICSLYIAWPKRISTMQKGFFIITKKRNLNFERFKKEKGNLT